MLVRICGFVLVALVGCIATSAQAYRVGLVNTETVLKELPDAIDASKKIEDMGLKIRDTLTMMQKEFETRIENYRKQEALMSAEAKKKEEESLNALRQRFLAYQEGKLGATGEIAAARETYLAPIRERVREAINLVAKEEKLNLVLDKVAGLVLFSEDKADITYKVLDRLKRGDK